MRPAIATVVGGRWEQLLVDHARTSGVARLVGRCTDLAGLEAVADRTDLVYLGSDAPWLAEVDLRPLARLTTIVGVALDTPGARLLHRAGVQEVVGPETALADLPGRIACLLPDTGRLIEVTGPRGAPGRSEIALALAHLLAGMGTALLELDMAAPSLGLRMALPPTRTRRLVSRDGIVFDPAPVAASGGAAIADRMRAVEHTRAGHRHTIVDSGPDSVLHRLVDVDEVVLVGTACDTGVFRLARLCETWTGPTPSLIVNRYQEGQDLRRVVRATGLEPTAVVPLVQVPAAGTAPAPEMMRSVAVVQRTAL